MNKKQFANINTFLKKTKLFCKKNGFFPYFLPNNNISVLFLNI